MTGAFLCDTRRLLFHGVWVRVGVELVEPLLAHMCFRHWPITRDVGLAFETSREGWVTSVGVIDGGPGKTLSSPLKDHQGGRPSHTGGDPLSRLARDAS